MEYWLYMFFDGSFQVFGGGMTEAVCTDLAGQLLEGLLGEASAVCEIDKGMDA